VLNSIIRNQTLVLAVPLFALIAASHPAHSEIYKWRDNRGVIQYSDSPPVENFTKVNRNEMVNALQTKDLCTLGPIVKNSPVNLASNQNVNAFFSKSFIASPKGKATINPFILPKTSTSSGGLIKTSMASATPTISKNNNVSFLASGRKVSVLNFSNKPIKTSTTTSPSTTTSTTTIAPPTTTTSTAPTTNTSTTPTLVATTSPTPTTTSTTSNSSNLIQVGLMPAVDITKNMAPVTGFNSLRIQPTTEIAPNSGGEFRIGCAFSHMSNDDPLIYPNQQGAAHHHTFFGNTSVNYKSDLNTFGSVGNSTCSGGIMNRSAYWVPSMINTETNAPILPNGNALIYYKSGAIDGATIKAPPKGLRIIAGNAKSIDGSVYNNTGFTCHPGPNSTRTSWPRTATLPTGSKCEAGDDLMLSIFFPQCWDGVNLDSPNHKDHMAYPANDSCPASHPVAIPQITVNVHFTIASTDKLDKWRLASDNYAFNGINAGYSAHSDYVEGWDRTAIEGIIKNCINAKKDCHAHLLGDARMFY